VAPPIRLAFIGNSLPRLCGIATFTTDLQQAVATCRSDIDTTIVAMTDHGQTYAYPSAVSLQINEARLEDYTRAAHGLNAARFDVVSLQHEFGIFGGEAGGHILALLSRLTMPVVTTLHTVLAAPEPAQRRVLAGVAERSAKLIVMAEKGRDILQSVYDIPAEKIAVIPHGIPDAPFVQPDAAKLKLGFSGRSVVLTFGLLSQNKGIEVMIDAMPAILKRRPDTVYVVLGATHPNLVRHQGEAYRESLLARARDRGVAEHVIFLDRFVDQPTLLDFISMCDIYVTPYLNEAQMTSGTLAYSFGMGKAVVSTRYWHARELLADGRGVLVPFNDSVAIGAAISGLLTADERRDSMRQRAYASSRSMTWERTAGEYVSLFERLRSTSKPKIVLEPNEGATLPGGLFPPQIQLDHFLLMCDDTGLFQHAIHCIPDRMHGYCIDDNARALILANALNAPGEQPMSETVSGRFSAFIQHAWNPDTRRFRNFMSFDRRWLEDSGSEDSHGRALWALGECALSDASPLRRSWASFLFVESCFSAAAFTSPRAWAFTLLGLDAFCEAVPDQFQACELRRELAERLLSILTAVEKPDWVWFEKGLAYENARLSQALIATGISTNTPVYTTAGLRSLRWLMRLQTATAGHFRPVGSQSFGERLCLPRPFDQQPLEATATISACRAAWRADGDPQWRTQALQAFAWFLGSNDLATPVVDVATGSCRDGLHPDRANENRGGESAVSYLLALAEIRKLHRTGSNRIMSPTRRALRTGAAIAPTTH